MEPKAAFGREVRRRRLALGVSQEALAEACDLHRTYIGGIERGERNVSLLNICRLAYALQCSVGELVEDVEAVPPPKSRATAGRDRT